MTIDRKYRDGHARAVSGDGSAAGIAPGKTTLTQQVQFPSSHVPVQAHDGAGPAVERRSAQATAVAGSAGSRSSLPSGSIQRLFGRSDASAGAPDAGGPPGAAPTSPEARDGNGVAAGAQDAVASAASTGGSALPGTVRSKFENSLGADLSAVRVHAGAESAAAADAVGARAYTTGQDIHFARGQYDPSSSPGEHLLAHEVAHTVQQSAGPPTRQHKLAVSTPFDAAEHEADRAADAMVSGATAAVTSAPSSAARQIQRETGADAHADGQDATSPGSPAPAGVDLHTAMVTGALTAVQRVRERSAALMVALGFLDADARATLATMTSKAAAFAGAYRAAWKIHVEVLEAAHKQATHDAEIRHAIESTVLGVGAAVLWEVTAPAALISASVAAIGPVGTGAAIGVAEHTAVEATQGAIHGEAHGDGMEATGADADFVKLECFKKLAEISTAFAKIASASAVITSLNANAELGIGELKAHSGDGTGAEGNLDQALTFAGTITNAGESLANTQSAIDAVKGKLAGAKAAIAASPDRTLAEIEKEIWTRWVAKLGSDASDTLSVKQIKEHLMPLGLIGTGLLHMVWDTDVSKAESKVADMDASAVEQEKRQRETATAAEREANAVSAAQAGAPAADAPLSGHVPKSTADFPIAKVMEARDNVSGLSMKVAAATGNAIAARSEVTSGFLSYKAHYGHAWGIYSGLMKQSKQEATESDAFINRIAGYAWAGLAGGASKGLEHLAEHLKLLGHPHTFGAKVLRAIGFGTPEKAGENAAHAAMSAESPATELVATGITPNAVGSTIYEKIVAVNDLASTLGDLRLDIGLVQAAAQYCLGEIKAQQSGGIGDMTEAEVLDCANVVISSASGLMASTPIISSAISQLDGVISSAATARTISSEQLERQMWILWMSNLPADSDLIDECDPIQEHLAAMGLIKKTMYYTDAEERQDLANASQQAGALKEDRKAIGVPSSEEEDGAKEKDGQSASP
jgi:hypothetical protein